MTRGWLNQLWSSACLAISLSAPSVSIEEHTLCLQKRQKPGPHGGSGVLVMAQLRNTLMQDVLILNRWLLMMQQVSTYIATYQLFRSAFPQEAADLKLCFSHLESWS